MSSTKEDYLENYKVDGLLTHGNVEVISRDTQELNNDRPTLTSNETAVLNSKLKKLQTKRNSIALQKAEIENNPATSRRLATVQIQQLENQLADLDYKIEKIREEENQSVQQDELATLKVEKYLQGTARKDRVLAFENGRVVEKEFEFGRNRDLQEYSEEFLEQMLLNNTDVEIAAPTIISIPERGLKDTTGKFTETLKALGESPVVIKKEDKKEDNAWNEAWNKAYEENLKDSVDLVKNLFGGGGGKEKDKEKAKAEAEKEKAKAKAEAEKQPNYYDRLWCIKIWCG